MTTVASTRGHDRRAATAGSLHHLGPYRAEAERLADIEAAMIDVWARPARVVWTRGRVSYRVIHVVHGVANALTWRFGNLAMKPLEQFP